MGYEVDFNKVSKEEAIKIRKKLKRIKKNRRLREKRRRKKLEMETEAAMLVSETSRLMAAINRTNPSFRSASELTDSMKTIGAARTVIRR